MICIEINLFLGINFIVESKEVKKFLFGNLVKFMGN